MQALERHPGATRGACGGSRGWAVGAGQARRLHPQSQDRSRSKGTGAGTEGGRGKVESSAHTHLF